MPRKPRIEFAGAVYHVMSRGNHQEAIFLEDRDREIFLDTLEEVCGRTGWRVHAFVLMGNHYHLLIETPEANLVAGMKWLQGTYTQRFNTRHKVWGHLFQGRYKALLVDACRGDYFSVLGSYIHLNPARARLFDLERGALSDFVWSSYPLYLKPSKRPSWLTVSRMLRSLGLSDDLSGRRRYSKRMQKRVGEMLCSERPWDLDARWASIRRGWCFGAEEFREEMLEKIENLPGERVSFSGEEVRRHDEQEAERLLVEGMTVLGLKEDDLSTMRKGAEEKALLAWLMRKHTAVPNAWIAERLQMGRPDCLSRYPRRIAESQDAGVVGKRKQLEKLLNYGTDPSGV